MLIELRVRDVGIIEDISWSLGPGLNVITGETGAGKSLVIDAIEALLGARPDDEMVRHGAGEARIEGVFSLGDGSGCAGLRHLLDERGLTADDDTLVILRELRRQGRGLMRINGQAVPRSLLQQVGRLLIDIHGQSEHLSLLDRKTHLSFLDSYAGTLEARARFASRAAELRRAQEELRALAEDERELARREEFLRYQLEEIRQAGLRPGEDEELERERSIIASAERLKALSYEAYQQLYGEEAGGPSASAVDRLSEAIARIRKLVELDHGLRPQLDSLEETLYTLEAAARDIRAYSDRLEYDPARLEQIEARLELIRSLKRKYGRSIADVLAFADSAAAELDGLSHSAERRAELEEMCSRLRQEMGQAGAALSRARLEAAERLKKDVERELQDLSMPDVRFEVAISRVADAEGIPYPDGETYAFSADGADVVEFMASTNPGEPPRPLARIASTGEVSRFMLALKGVLSANDDIPILVFDEIDIGVGGRSGEVIGRKLWTLARRHQTICITHLPQVAAFADAHYAVRKEVSGERALSRLVVLEGEARTEELAAMLAGPHITGTSMDGARELLQRAAGWKERHAR